MPRWICYPAIFAIALLLCAVRPVSAQVCQHCGCDDCHKVCRLVCEDKKVPVTCWGCKCEDFCIGNHSKPSCKHCEEVCTEGDCTKGEDDICVQPKKFVWREWCPSCAKVFHKKKLMKMTITKKVPSFKWVVEDVCDKCDAKSPGAELPPDGTIPKPPLASVPLRYRPAAPQTR